MPPLLLAVMGPTGSGKTPLAEALAGRLNAQLINADAFQIYRGMDVGTAKPERKALYELMDIKEPTEDFGVGEFVERSMEILKRLYDQKKSAIVVGGSGLYIRALFQGYGEMHSPPDPEIRGRLEKIKQAEGVERLAAMLQEKAPEVAARTDLKNPARVRRALEKLTDDRPPLRFELPSFRRLKLGLMPNRETLHIRIDSRLQKMVQNGWIEEVGRLRKKGVPREAPGLRAIGYRALYDHLAGSISLEAALEGIGLETRQYAKRQRTWLRSEPDLLVLEGELTTEQAIKAAMRAIASRD